MIVPKLLIVDDDEDIRFTLKEILLKEGYKVDVAQDGFEAIQKVTKTPYDLILLDIRMPKMDGIQALVKLKEIKPGVVVIMITAHGNRELALQAVEKGAYDYFNKPFDINELRIVIRRALEKCTLERELVELQSQKVEFENIIGNSRIMQDVFQLIRQVAKLDVTVLVVGESGTGKELVAQAIHYNSPRKANSFVKMNCVAIPEGLLESELFGHERGAFTGATDKHIGKFELAQGGTLFLDEIGDMAIDTQSKLLRVIQEREVERVGGNQKVKVDIRLITATNQDLVKAVKEKRFREDLYFRINVVPVFLPPLRERTGDIPLLLEYFMQMYNAKFGKSVKKVSSEVQQFILHYPWPGNIREFENFVQRAIALAESDTVTNLPLPINVQAGNKDNASMPLFTSEGINLSETINQMTSDAEKKYIIQALQQAKGNRTVTARLLGLSRKGLYDKLAKYDIPLE